MNGLSPIPENYLRVATCGRVVGLKGEITIWPISNIDERYIVGTEYIDESGHKLIIKKIRRHKDHFVVLFEEMSKREDVEFLVNRVLYAEPLNSDSLDEGEFFAHDALGKVLLDQHNIKRGKVIGFISNAASDLLEIDTGDLIPFKFINAITNDHVLVNAPDGLFGLNESNNLNPREEN